MYLLKKYCDDNILVKNENDESQNIHLLNTNYASNNVFPENEITISIDSGFTEVENNRKKNVLSLIAKIFYRNFKKNGNSETNGDISNSGYIKNLNVTSQISETFSGNLRKDERNNIPLFIEPAVKSFILKYKYYFSKTEYLQTNDKKDIDTMKEKIQNIINLNSINNIRYINKFFIAVNKKLLKGGIFIGCVESNAQRKNRIYSNNMPVLSRLIYGFDFVINRIFPKIFLTKKLYYSITKGKNRAISIPETLGRLISCGFEILGYKEINKKTYFAAKMKREPKYENSASYGFLIRLKRVGKNGKQINVYKFRTMYPFSEYLQEYIYKTNKLKDGGKFNDDFRITYWGKILRKLRIDEIPMLLNFIKGEVKLVGVRPLSQQYYNMYEEDIRNRRIKYKPGLLPPFFADLPKTLSEIMDSERNYLDRYEINRFKTDLFYFAKIIFNINFKKAMGE